MAIAVDITVSSSCVSALRSEPLPRGCFMQQLEYSHCRGACTSRVSRRAHACVHVVTKYKSMYAHVLICGYEAHMHMHVRQLWLKPTPNVPQRATASIINGCQALYITLTCVLFGVVGVVHLAYWPGMEPAATAVP